MHPVIIISTPGIKIKGWAKSQPFFLFRIIKRKKRTEVRNVKPDHAAPSLQTRKNPGLQSRRFILWFAKKGAGAEQRPC